MKKTFFVIILSFWVVSQSSAQSSALYLHSPQDDITLFDGYWAPMRKGMINSAAMGLGSSGKILEKGKVKFSASVITVKAPQSATFQPMSDGVVYKQIGGTATVPTILGGEVGPLMKIDVYNPITDSLEPLREFYAPSGINSTSLSQARVSFAVGVGHGLEFQGRVIAPIDLGPWSPRGGGVGVKFEVGKIIPATISLPVDLAIQVGYNQLRTHWDLPLALIPGTTSFPLLNSLPPTNQMVTHQALAQVLVSKKIGPITPFLSAGMSRNESIVSVVGDFPSYNILLDEQTGEMEFVANNTRSPYYKLEGSFRGHLEAGLEAEISVLRLRLSCQVGEWLGISAGIGVAL